VYIRELFGRELTKQLLEPLAIWTTDHIKTAAIRRQDVPAIINDNDGIGVLLQQV
jgi:hypothetical protein